MSKVLEFLKSDGGMYKTSEIAEKIKIDKKVVDNEIKKLVKEGLAESPKRCYYKAN